MRQGARAAPPATTAPALSGRRALRKSLSQESGSASAVRSTSQTPSRQTPVCRDATSSASRVFPAPPRPVNVTSRRSPEEGLEFGELGFASDEARRLERGCCGGAQRLDDGDVVAKHCALECSQLFARLESESRCAASLSLGDTPRAHRLAVRIGTGRARAGARRRSRRGSSATRRSSSATSLAWCPSARSASIRSSTQTSREFIQPLRLQREGALLGDVGERRPSPQPESGVQPLGGKTHGTAVERVPTLVEQPPEAVSVDLVGTDLQRVPGRPGDDHVVADHPAQPRDVRAKRRRRARRRTPAPQLVAEPVHRQWHGLVPVGATLAEPAAAPAEIQRPPSATTSTAPACGNRSERSGRHRSPPRNHPLSAGRKVATSLQRPRAIVDKHRSAAGLSGPLPAASAADAVQHLPCRRGVRAR